MWIILAVIIPFWLPTSSAYFCLEYWKPLGHVLHEVTFPGRALTSGQLARECNEHCTADPSCTAAWSVAGVTTAGPGCRLLQHTAADVAAALQPAAGRSYPRVQPSFKAANGSQEKSLSWLCLKHQADWDDLGAITSNLVRPGATDPSWCAYATDAAGNNLNGDWAGGSSLAACGDSCAANSQCSFWVGRPQHCWLKYSPLVGSDGWTAAYRSSWLSQTVKPNAAVTCFKRLQDWRELGQQLSPNVTSMQHGGLWFTLFPERVNFTEASAACSQLPGGNLAQLDTQEAVNVVGSALLPTLPMQYTLQVAWVGAQGILDGHAASLFSGDVDTSKLPALDSSPAPAAATAGGAGGQVTWSGSSQAVNTSLFSHPSEHYLQWRGSDSSFRQYVPHAGRSVCVAAIGVPPGAQGRGQATPGLYLFTCRRPTAFICQSTSLPALLTKQTGRMVPQATPQQEINTSSSNDISKQRLALAVLLPVLAALLLSAAGCVCLRQLRTLLHTVSTQRKRALGLPTKGYLTVVVTDIQGYTHLSEAHPQAMGQALLLHNQVIREAAYTNAGHVLAVEGDAFIVGFCEPLDAAVFALQIQHHMMKLRISPQLKYPGDDGDSAAAVSNGQPARLTATSNGRRLSAPEPLYQQQEPHQRSLSTFPAAATRTQSALPVLQKAPSSLAAKPDTADATVVELPPWPAKGPAAAQGSDGVMSSAATNPRTVSTTSLRTLLCLWSTTSTASSSSSQVHGSSGTLPQHSLAASDTGNSSSPVAVGLSSSSGSLSRWLRSGAGGSRWRALLTQQGRTAQPGLFRGLRVRVGLATGPISRGQAVEMTAAYSMARVISECAAGGQVLLDAATFQAIRPELHLLGAVGASGLDYGRLEGKLNPAAAAAAACLRLCRPSREQPGSKGRPEPRDAIVLDMGLYEGPLPCAAMQAGVSGMHPGSLQPMYSITRSAAGIPHELPQTAQHTQQLQQQSTWQRAVSFVSSAASSGIMGVARSSSTQLSLSESGRPDPCRGHIRLYQLLAPELVGRAVLFGTKLSLCANWRCIDPPFFAAPGLCGAGLQGGGCDAAGTPDSAPTPPKPQHPPAAGSASSSPSPRELYCPQLACSCSTLAALRALSVNAPLPGAHVLSNQGGLDRGAAPPPRFPPVAMVFVVVAGSESLQQRQYPGTGHLHALVSRLMLEACVLFGGYLVKTSEAELKYMAAFSTTAAALEWCLLLQEAALHLPYHSDLLKQPGFEAVVDAGGQLVFCGPRLKMGVAEGPPTCITPDHMGRADYLGPVVNSAARVCDAAAHGGQVALEQGPATNVLQHWQAKHAERQQQAAATQDAAAAPPHLSAATTPAAASDMACMATEAPVQGTCGSAPQQQRPGALADSLVPVQVAVQQLGCFLFKGCAKGLHVVHITPQRLASRRFPAEAPRGKGVRLASACGVLQVVTVWLPASVAGLQNLFAQPV